MVHKILHAISEGKECRFYLGTCITTHAHGEVLKILLCLDSDVHEGTNPVIKQTTPSFFKFF